MTDINFKREIPGTIDEIVTKITELLAAEGFGILTRIDFDKKIKEKLNKKILPVVILGACNPTLAYEAYLRNTDITGLIPCNAVVREIDDCTVSVELVKPTALMTILGNEELKQLSQDADLRLRRVIDAL